MNYLPYPLSFFYRFNLHKTSGFLIEDSDTKTLSKIYGVRKKELCKIEQEFTEILEKKAEQIRLDIPEFKSSKKAPLLCIGDSITSDRHYAACLNYDFTTASIFIGTNDARGHEDDKNITNTSIREYLITSILERGKSVINITVPPVDNVRLQAFFGGEVNYYYRQSVIDEVNAVIRELSEKHGTRLADFADITAKKGEDVLDVDGVHLNAKGNESAARLVLGCITE